MIDLENDSPRSSPAVLAALRQWVRGALQLPTGVVAVVTELTCREVGCPPIETVIAVMLPQGGTWQFTVHKPAQAFDDDDRARLVAAWRGR